VSGTAAQSLKLVYLSGPTVMEPIELSPERAHVLGRSSSCEVMLEDPNSSISRRHLELSNIQGQWSALDIGSRNGTVLNAEKLLPNLPTPVKHGDMIRLGSWAFRVLTRADEPTGSVPPPTLIHTMNDTSAGTHLVERVSDEPLSTLASHRLAVLLECSDQIHQASTLEEAGKISLHAMIESTGYSRGAFIQPLDELGRYQPIAFESKNPLENVSAVNFSQSLLESAAKGKVVRLAASGTPIDYGQSIADLDIHSALCIPIGSDTQFVGYLYLDARGSENAVRHDASAFGQAIGRLLGLTASNLRSKDLEIKQHAMQYDLDAAANAQRLLLPPETGRVGAVSYSMLMRPGRQVAGDLFGVVGLEDGRVCVFLGDVSGKGVGSAILMATTQSYIHAMLDQTTDLPSVVNKLNRHIAERSTGQFVTMWIGIIEPCADGGTVEFIDAGHGHWLVTQKDHSATRPAYTGGLVVGIDPEMEFNAERFTLGQDQRLVLFSDGVVEQVSPLTDEEYSLKRAGAFLSGCSCHSEDVSGLLEDVLAFAQSEDLRDDTTIASIGIC